MTAVFDVRDVDGRMVERTIGEALADFIRLGHYMETACALCGIGTETVYGWLRIGARVLECRQQGVRPRDLTAHERRCADFSDTVRTALAEAEDRDVRLLGMLGRGGLPRVTVVEEVELDDDGQERLVKRTTRSTRTLPDAASLRWRLERRFPERWGRQEHVDVDVHDDDDSEWGEDPVEIVRRMLDGISRRTREVREAALAHGDPQFLAELEAIVTGDDDWVPPDEHPRDVRGP